MACGCGASCAAGACASACAAAACSGAMVAIMASNLHSNSDYGPAPFDILCKNCKHDSTEHDHKGCKHTDGFFRKTQCTCRHFNFDNDKLEKAKNEIIDVLFKHLKEAEELQSDRQSPNEVKHE